MAQAPIINASIAREMIALVDFCYRKGIEDAYRVEDEGLAREFIEKTSQVGVYGFLREDGATMSWKEWTLRLMAQARMTFWNGPMSRYLMLIGKRPNQNYLGVFLPVSQVFYNKGVSDYCDNKQECDFMLFQERTRVLWTKNGLKPINNRRYVDEILLVCFDLQRRDKAVWENETDFTARKLGTLTVKQYDTFIRAIGLAMQNKNNKL